MTKYQIARFKRAVKRDLTKELLSPRGKNYVAEKRARSTHTELPDYVTNNPWY